MTIAWSYGGGVQTAALAVLIKEGKVARPDITVIADTGRERKTTWDYLHNVIQPYLAPAGITVEIAPHTLSRVDLFDKSGLTLIPAYGPEGRKAAFCSGEWKRDVVERYLRQRGVEDCEQYLGFSLDESHRATGKAHRPWCRPRYPLLELGITRRRCLAIVAAAGLPEPPKSRCWMCPHQNAEEWRQVRDDPVEWAAAVALEKQVNELDPEPERGRLYLHASRVPLELADLGKPGDDMPLFRHCQDAGCYT